MRSQEAPRESRFLVFCIMIPNDQSIISSFVGAAFCVINMTKIGRERHILSALQPR